MHVENSTARFGGQFRQRVDLKQPKAEALRWLAARGDALVNSVEIALDFAFSRPADSDDAYHYFSKHLVRRWHTKRQGVRLIEATRYDASRAARSVIAMYPEDVSRITGELNVVHLEWRAKGAQGVRSAGINQADDLLTFNHQGFWSRRLLLYEADKWRLGRYFRNIGSGGKRRAPATSDWRIGHALLMSGGQSIQEMLDNFAGLRLQRVLSRIDVTEILERIGEE